MSSDVKSDLFVFELEITVFFTGTFDRSTVYTLANCNEKIIGFSPSVEHLV